MDSEGNISPGLRATGHDPQPEMCRRRSKHLEFDVHRSDKKKDNGLKTGFDQIDPSSSKL